VKLPRAGVLGLGKAGGSLAASLHLHGCLVATASRSKERRDRFLARHPGAPRPRPSLTKLLTALEQEGGEVLFLAVPDDVLPALGRRLARAPWLPPVIAHLSGSIGAEALFGLATRTVPAAFHPLAALDGERPIPEGTLLAVAARRAPVTKRLLGLASALGLAPAEVRPGAHARYHLGAVVSANLAVALLDEGVRHLAAAGIDEELARVSLARLLDSTARAAEARPLPQMLTGPIARGDVGTVERHLEALASTDEESRWIYQRLSLRLLGIAKLDAPRRARLEALLTSRGR
jgi:predicted short-subunit dehydrogenase-like oxidoreductase (DUF2520 family)